MADTNENKQDELSEYDQKRLIERLKEVEFMYELNLLTPEEYEFEKNDAPRRIRESRRNWD